MYFVEPIDSSVIYKYTCILTPPIHIPILFLDAQIKLTGYQEIMFNLLTVSRFMTIIFKWQKEVE